MPSMRLLKTALITIVVIVGIFILGTVALTVYEWQFDSGCWLSENGGRPGTEAHLVPCKDAGVFYLSQNELWRIITYLQNGY